MLARSPQRELALEELMAAQQRPGAAEYRQWLSPGEFGLRFGPSAADLRTLTDWLAGQGFSNVKLNSGRTVVEFDATAGTLRSAFGAEMHGVSVGGATFMASMSGVNVPKQLQALVAGVASLTNVPRGGSASAGVQLRRDNRTGVVGLAPMAGDAHPNLTLASNNTVYYAISPADFATIYDVNPLWNAATPIDGTGQTIAVVGDTDINPVDFVSFRTIFGLPLGNTTTSTGTQYLNIIYNGPKPAVLADEFHADSDTQWAGAAAKGAVIDYVASQTTEASNGVDLSAAYVVDNNLAQVLVDSYFSCELTLGSSGNAFYRTLWQQAAAQGIAVVTAAGDAGAAGCDGSRVGAATLGAKVNGVGSTPYDVSVGATEFYTPSGVAAYFNTTNSATFGSAKGYIPEAVWNDSCTNAEILTVALYVGLTAEQACNSSSAKAAGIAVTVGSGGGASSCTTSNGVTAASCSGGYVKPSWQSGAGVPADGVRDVPDVALFGSQGRTNSFYVVCQQSRNTDGQSCNLNFPYSDFSGYGGSALAAPAFASILSLASQQNAPVGGRLGNPNQVLYGLATQQRTQGLSCNATGSPAAGCVFHDVTMGTNGVPCTTGTPGCVTATAGDATGILAGANAGAGYDLATGLGSVDAAQLVTNWNSVKVTTTSALLSMTPQTVVHGVAVTATVTVTGSAPTGLVSLNSQVDNGSVGTAVLASGTATESTATQSFMNFPGGTYGVRAHYGGDATNGAVDSNFVSLTVAPEGSTTTIRPLAFDPRKGTTTLLTAAPYGDIFYIRSDVAGLSGQGVATGNVAVTDNGTILGSGISRLNSSGYTEAQNNALAPGTHQFGASYAGDASFNASTANTATLTISRATTTAKVSTSVSTVSVAGTVTFTGTIGTTSYGFAAPTGTVTFMAGTQVLGSSRLAAGTDGTTFYRTGTAVLTLSASPFPIGQDSITVVYPGDLNYLRATSALANLGVTDSPLTPTMTTLTASPTQVAAGGAITLTAAVSPTNPAPTGTVQFVIDGQNVSGPVLLTNDVAGLALGVGSLSLGSHAAVAVYSGDTTHYRSSMSVAVPFVVASPGLLSTPAFTATPTTAVQGTFISVAASVGPISPVATGTLQLVLDGGPYGSAFAMTNAAAVLPLITTTLQVGSHVVTVFYSGDGNYAPRYAAPATILITAPGVTPSSITLSGLGQVNQGAAGTFTATVAAATGMPGSPVPTGIFEITIDGGNPGSPILLHGAANVLTLPATLGLGTHTVSVFYSGDAIYNFSRSVTSSFNVVVPVVTGTFTLTPTAINVTGNRLSNSSPTVLYSVTPTGGFLGTVAFSCANLPKNTSCSFAPASVALTGTASANTVLTLVLNTGIKSGAGAAAPLAGLAGLLGLCWFGRRRRVVARMFAVLLMVGLLGMAGCGGGYSPGASPAGVFTVTVVATSGSIVQTGTVQLTIE